MTNRPVSRATKIEKLYPGVIGCLLTIVVAVVISWTKFYPASGDMVANILSATIDFSAITVGFLLTALSILPSLDGKAVIRNLRSNQSYSKLINYIYSAASWFLILVLLSMACFLIDVEEPKDWHYWISNLWILVFFVSTISYYRAISIFISILRSN